MIDARRRCSQEFALAVLGCTHRELDDLVRAGRITKPTVGAEDFDFDQINSLATALDAERRTP